MKVSNIIPYFIRNLDNYNDREIVSIAYVLISYLFNFNKSETILFGENEISNENWLFIKDVVVQLKSNKPIQYILGQEEFYNLKLKVNKYTLIPRPETEELVDWILEEKFNSALDIGTGTGCIAIALSKHSNASVTASDISNDVLNVAKKNAKNNDVNINFIKQDILNVSSMPKYDLIVSNPPYITNAEKIFIRPNVIDYEPHNALFVLDKEPLIFYKKISLLASVCLNNNGKLFFEINEKFGDDLIKMLSNLGFVDIELKKDLNDKDRMIKATKN